jgi:hypothetical protein
LELPLFVEQTNSRIESIKAYLFKDATLPPPLQFQFDSEELSGDNKLK